MSTNHHDDRPALPAGLTYCEICGEPKGTAIDGSIELFDDETEEDRLIKVSCYCDAIDCTTCGRQTRHRPISDYYDVEDERFVHVPHSAAGQACRDCRREAERKCPTPHRGTISTGSEGTAGNAASFYYHRRDGVLGRKNSDGTFDSLMPSGIWRRGVPDMNIMVCDPVTREEARRIARHGLHIEDVDFDAQPTEKLDYESGDFVPFDSDDPPGD